MTPIGGNYWCTGKGSGGLALDNQEIEKSYLFQESKSGEAAFADLWGAISLLSPAAVRVPLILAERDDVETRFGHIPPRPKELQLVRDFLHFPIPRIFLTITRLWEAAWIGKEQGTDIGENPFDTPQALADDLYATLEAVIGNGLPPNVSIDLDCESTFDAAFSLYYPRAAALCMSHNIQHTASVIVDIGGNTDRHLQGLDKLCTMARPSFAELHWNGEQASVIEAKARGIVQGVQDRFGLPVVWGECDCELTAGALAALLNSGAREVILWV